jgi:membrane-associated phospholipid phosphatase
MTRFARRVWLIAALWVLAIAVTLLIDRPVAEWVARTAPLNKHGMFARLLKLPGDFLYFTLPLIALVVLFNRRHWIAAIPLLLASLFQGASYSLLKWLIGRHRPVLKIDPFAVHPFAGGWHGLMHAESGLSFPSGHAALAFATATVMGRLLPRWRPAFFFVAALVGVERVAENAHYVSDVIAGAGLGVLCGLLAIRVTNGPRRAASGRAVRGGGRSARSRG